MRLNKGLLNSSQISGNRLNNILGITLGNEKLTSDGFTYTNFASTDGLILVSTDGVSGNALYITNAVTGNVGNIYRSTAINFNRNFSFEWIFECSGGTGADGFCLQWTPTNNSNGLVGGGVGLLSNAVNAITFLTFTNNNEWH